MPEPAPPVTPAPAAPAQHDAPQREEDGSDSIEHELKLAASAKAVAALAGETMLTPGLTLSAGETVHVQDRYLDTPDRAFLRMGFVLRERIARGAEGESRMLTLKGLAKRDKDGSGIHRRLEVEGPIAGSATEEDRAGWPGAVLDLAMVIAGTRLDRLEVLVELQQQRTERTARGPDGMKLGTLSLDKARALDLAGGEAERWHEVEFELSPCPPEYVPLQQRAMQALRDRKGLHLGHGSKFERAMQAVADHPPGSDATVHGIQPNMPMAEACRLIWRTQLTTMLLSEAGARRGDDIDYVHDYRVSIRRARAANRLFGAYFERKRIKPFLKHMKRTARLLGGVRDRDVALRNLAAHRAKLSPEESAAMEPIAERWRRQRREAYEVLLPWLDSPRHRQFVRDFTRFCATPGEGALSLEAPTPYQIRHVLPDAIWSRYSAVRAYEPLLEQGEPPVDTLHALRIDCKRLRYSLEPVRPLLGREGSALIKQLKRLQDHLGDLNDTGVTMADLDRSRAEGDDDEALEHYSEVQRAAEERLRRSFREHWAPFVGEENRARLGRSLARL